MPSCEISDPLSRTCFQYDELGQVLIRDHREPEQRIAISKKHEPAEFGTKSEITIWWQPHVPDTQPFNVQIKVYGKTVHQFYLDPTGVEQLSTFNLKQISKSMVLHIASIASFVLASCVFNLKVLNCIRLFILLTRTATTQLLLIV